MSGCEQAVSTLKHSRNHIQIPDPESCGRKTVYYGKGCQFMQISGVTDEVRSGSDLIRTWQRGAAAFCTIGSSEAPPAVQTLTVEFYETCEGGIPLPHTLGRCRWRVIVNHGLCRFAGNAVSGWSQYSEVYDLLTLSRDYGRRTSYDGADDARTVTITAELHNIYQIGPMNWRQIDLDGACTALNLDAVMGAFACNVGCGEDACGCVDACDDGSQTFYIPSDCDGGANDGNQLLSYTTDGGETMETAVVPVPSVGATPSTPYVVVDANQLYLLGYEDPAVLYRVSLDSYGEPTGSWSLIETFGTTGQPAGLVAENGYIHVLIQDTANGSRHYRFDGNTMSQPETFDVAADMSKLSACGSRLVVGGVDGAMEISYDNGGSWVALAAPAELTTGSDILSLELNGSRVWIGSDSGQFFTTHDYGTSWKQLAVQGAGTGDVNSINFAGDDIGWIGVGAQAPFSTWIGGTNASDWTNQDPRINNFPDGVTVHHVTTPECAESHIASNTALVVGTNAAGETVAYIGRTNISGA